MEVKGGGGGGVRDGPGLGGKGGEDERSKATERFSKKSLEKLQVLLIP